jgi:hypothetical protein
MPALARSERLRLQAAETWPELDNCALAKQELAGISRALGEATDLREAKAATGDFQSMNIARRSFWRTMLKIRVSGGKATRLAQQLF